MAKKQFFLIVDTESTIKDTCADFGAIICDRKGKIYTQISVLVHGHFDKFELFHDKNSADELWTLQGLEKRKAAYSGMLEQGTRSLASVGAINRWLEKAAATYSPELTAYNLAFDLRIMRNTGIDCNLFPKRFCLWQAALGNFCKGRKFRQFVLDNHYLGARTKHGNMCYKTNADVLAKFVLNSPELENEPHTALEDVLGYELPILLAVLKKPKWREKITAFNWRDVIVKNAFKAK